MKIWLRLAPAGPLVSHIHLPSSIHRHLRLTLTISCNSVSYAGSDSDSLSPGPYQDEVGWERKKPFAATYIRW